MTDMERFTEFLLREAARYHEPSRPPRRRMWVAIEDALRSATSSQSPAGDQDDLTVASERYHVPPVTPHDAMWTRIESAWEMRRSAPERARHAGLDELPMPLAAEDSGSGGRRLTRWASGIAIAASLVIGIAIGRGTVPAVDGPLAVDDGRAGASPGESVGQSPSDPLAGDGEVFAVGPLEAAGATDEASLASDPSPSTGVIAPTTPPPTTLAVADAPTASPTSADRSPGAPTRWNVAVRLATAKHLGQAETLLTSFRADEPAEEAVPISGWARDLLGETRLLLDLPVDRSPAERALLEELELVLAQIAGLRPDAPGFERDLIAEGLVREGTIARLRAAAPPGAGATIGT